jgi:hypothetical protein
MFELQLNAEAFESDITELTKPLNGQYPRPWMTDLCDPLQAKVFIVGRNQAKTYSVESIGDHSRHLNALFNRNGETCRGLYDELSKGKSSPTRQNIDFLANELRDAGVYDILETNVICYSTPMSADLSRRLHAGGLQRGHEIFRYLLKTIRPSMLIVHGESSRRALEKALGAKLASIPSNPANVTNAHINYGGHDLIVYAISSLAPPAFNAWKKWSPEYLHRLAVDIADQLSHQAA